MKSEINITSMHSERLLRAPLPIPEPRNVSLLRTLLSLFLNLKKLKTPPKWRSEESPSVHRGEGQNSFKAKTAYYIYIYISSRLHLVPENLRLCNKHLLDNAHMNE